MSTYLAEKYARLLSDDDTISLFNRLKEVVGNIKEAAERCGLTRKSVYDWENLTQEIRLATKERVLEQSLELLPIDTLEYLTKQTVDAAYEVLLSNLGTLYENALEQKEPAEFERLAT